MTPTERQATYEAAVLAHWGAARDAAHDLGHLRRVWRNCQRIALDHPEADAEVLLAAAIFHDVVNLPKNHPDRAQASRLSAEFACTWLAQTDFPPEKLNAVAHAIAAHSFSAGIAPETLEARILQDADRLEALGALGIARMFSVAGAMGGALFDSGDPLAQNRPLDDRAFALDHLEVKLFPIVQTMQTAEGRRMAEEAAEWMASFRTRLLREIG
ncbi:HD domain-containing protein [Gemmobacter denitrificans]|uniref:HD domain-containing protein n=1 Tax=Gemmobacter denitrificans TaxID=3123040 RepID=A0ABU8BZV1_9RHOB